MTMLSVIDLDPADRLVRLVRQTLTEALAASIDRDQGIFAIEGMSGARYRWFINRLIRRLGPVGYLEVGSWTGSTICAAIHGNAVRALAIDNWSQFGGPRDTFLANVGTFRTEAATVALIEGDFRAVDYPGLATQLPPFDVYLFDGPHAEADQHDGLAMALPMLADRFVFICDDWNWAPVRAGTYRAILETGLTLVSAVEIRTSLDESHGAPAGRMGDWHNGYFVGVLRKPPC